MERMDSDITKKNIPIKKAQSETLTTQPSHHKIIRHKKLKALFISIILISIAGGGSLYLLESQPSLVAKFADNVLRPTLGNKNTIILENLVFSFSDHLKQIVYGTVGKPKGNIFNAEPAQKPQSAPKPTIQSLNLTTINDAQPGYPLLEGEGQWTIVNLPQFNNQQIMARTFVRPDPDRSYAIVALIQMNMHYLTLNCVAGTYYPGGDLGHPGPGIIPAADQASNNLVAAFNGGFQYMDGHYGMTVGANVYVPLTEGLGSLIIYQDGSSTIEKYDSTKKTLVPIAAVRQNGPLILDKGQVTADATSGGYQVWGRTTTNSVYTWRSGVGMTASGNLVYAVGPSLTAATLAQSLKLAGATVALQLDINQFWVRFATFTPATPGAYNSESILNTLQNGGPQYLHGYNKDFFYLMMRPPITHQAN